MKETYGITKTAIREWWSDLSRKGHLIIIGFAVGLILAFAAIIISTYYAAQSKAIYRNQIKENSDRIEDLERRNDK